LTKDFTSVTNGATVVEPSTFKVTVLDTSESFIQLEADCDDYEEIKFSSLSRRGSLNSDFCGRRESIMRRQTDNLKELERQYSLNFNLWTISKDRKLSEREFGSYCDLDQSIDSSVSDPLLRTLSVHQISAHDISPIKSGNPIHDPHRFDFVHIPHDDVTELRQVLPGDESPQELGSRRGQSSDDTSTLSGNGSTNQRLGGLINAGDHNEDAGSKPTDNRKGDAIRENGVDEEIKSKDDGGHDNFKLPKGAKSNKNRRKRKAESDSCCHIF